MSVDHLAERDDYVAVSLRETRRRHDSRNSAHPPIEYIGRAGWMKRAVLISCPSFLAAMLSRMASAIDSSSAPARSIVFISVSSRLKRQFRSLPSAVIRNRSQLMQNGRLTEEMKPTFPTPSA